MPPVQPQLLHNFNPLGDFWENFTTTAVQAWDTVWEKGGVIPHIVTWLFFRVISLIAPGIVGFEVLLCHAVAIIHLFRFNAREADLDTELRVLRPLGNTNRQLQSAATANKLILDRVRGERDHALKDIDAAHAERDEANRGKAALTHERDELLKAVDKLRAELNAAIDQRNDVEANVSGLQKENESLSQSVETLKNDLQQASCNKELFSSLLNMQRFYEINKKRGKLFEEHHSEREEALKQFEEVSLAEANRIDYFRAKLEDCKKRIESKEKSEQESKQGRKQESKLLRSPLLIIIDSLIVASEQDQLFKDTSKMFFQLEKDLYINLQKVPNERDDPITVTKSSATIQLLE